MARRALVVAVSMMLVAVLAGCSATGTPMTTNPGVAAPLCEGEKADNPACNAATSLDASNGIDNNGNGQTDDTAAAPTPDTTMPTLAECKEKYKWLEGKDGSCRTSDEGSTTDECAFTIVIRDYGCGIRCEGIYTFTAPADKVTVSPAPPASDSLVTPDLGGTGARICTIY